MQAVDSKQIHLCNHIHIFTKSSVMSKRQRSSSLQVDPFRKLTQVLLLFWSYHVFHSCCHNVKANTPSSRNRILEASIIAKTWPTIPSSPLCETYAYLDSVPSAVLNQFEDDNMSFHGSWKLQFLSTLSSVQISSSSSEQQQQQQPLLKSFNDGYKLALQIASNSYPSSKQPTSTTDFKLLQLALSTRAYAPMCETWRKLSQQAMQHIIHQQLHNSKNYHPFNVNDYDISFFVIEGTQKIAFSTHELLEFLASSIKDDDNDYDFENRFSPWNHLLSHEVPLFQHYTPPPSSSSSNVRNQKKMKNVILYGNFDSIQFASFFQFLMDHNNYNNSNGESVLHQNKIPFVVRHIGAIHYEQSNDVNDDSMFSPLQHSYFDPSSMNTTNNKEPIPTVLQGYGVRLDIRNVEYKAFDDNNSNNNNNLTTATQMENANSQHDVHEEYTDEVRILQDNNLIHLFPNVQSKYPSSTIPPSENLHDLSLQATTVIYSSKDPLWTLQHIAQNLPSHALPLSQLLVPSSIRQGADLLLRHQHPSSSSMLSGSSSIMDDGIFHFYVNGRRIAIERPSFNLFELLNVFREEDVLLNSVEKSLGIYFQHDADCLNIVSDLLSMGKESFDMIDHLNGDSTLSSSNSGSSMMSSPSGQENIRVDVGRGYRGAIIYINDIEKDKEYSHWPRQVDQMFMAMQFGAPPTVRRNILTVLLVVDPLMDTDLNIVYMIYEMMQNGYPLRVGLLIANSGDIDACRKAYDDNNQDKVCDIPNPVPDKYLRDDDYDDVELMQEAVNTHTIYKLIQHTGDRYGRLSILPYLFSLMTSLQEKKREKRGIIKIKDLFDCHSDFMKSTGAPSTVIRSSFFEAITNIDESKTDTYAKSLRFAITKNIKPFMGFINGLIIPTHDAKEGQDVIFNELNHIMSLIMERKITDSSPRSVYSLLLTGKNVHKKLHPLLNEKKPKYALYDFTFDDKSLLQIHHNENSSEFYLIELVVDFFSHHGINRIYSFLSTLEIIVEKFNNDMKWSNTSIAVRILPSDLSSSKSILRTLFRSVSDFDVKELLPLFREFKGSSITDDEMKRIISLSGIQDRLNRIIDNDSCFNTPINASIQDCKHASKNEGRKVDDYVTVNGRILSISDTISIDDIEMMIDLERQKARTIANKLQKHLRKDLNVYDAVGRTAALLGHHFSSINFLSDARVDVQTKFKPIFTEARSTTKSPFYYEWNKNSDENPSNTSVKVKVTVILDPLTEATQKVAPLLRLVRDHLQLPLTVILTPRVKIVKDSKIPLTSYYRFVAQADFTTDVNFIDSQVVFNDLPWNHLLTVRMDVPEPWDVQQIYAIQDTDNLRCELHSCGDNLPEYIGDEKILESAKRIYLTQVQYNLNHLLFFGQCYDVTTRSPPNGLQLTLHEPLSLSVNMNSKLESLILPDGSVSRITDINNDVRSHYSDTLVMKTVGYWQLRANPGAWVLKIAEQSKGATIYDMVKGSFINGDITVSSEIDATTSQTLVMKDFVNRGELILVKKRPGFESEDLLSYSDEELTSSTDDDTIHVFSLATGHQYERFLKIMMLSVTKRSSKKVKFWLFENFLSPSFKASAKFMAKRIGCELDFVSFKWPEFLRGQSEKQRIIWGYKILFLDVLFPLNLKKIIYVDADQVVRGDLKELWDLDLEGAPYGYTPFCESREETLGFQFWRTGFWANHLRGKPYHISALYVVDLLTFRKELVGDKLRGLYQQLSSDPNNLSNLDQDLPNFAQHQVKIHSLPQEWLWCESWCSDETKVDAKTIDLCNNPLHKESKVSMAKRVISGDLFKESWIELDMEVQQYEDELKRIN